MFCRNCGSAMGPNAAFCVKCGVKAGDGVNYCPNCGASTAPNAVGCIKCGAALKRQFVAGQKSRVLAGLLGIFLGGLGIHNFYLGYTVRAVIQIIVTFATCGIGSLWGFIEGILILTGYIATDANGVPLGD